MPEEVQTTAPPPSAEPAAPSPAIEIPKDPDAYAEWRASSGRKYPAPAPAPAKADGKPKEEASAPSSSETSASEAETKKSQEKQQQQPPRPRRSNEGDRVNEFLDDIRALGLKPNDLKLSREELYTRLSPPQPGSEPKPASAAAPAAPEAPKKPQFKDFNGDWDAYDAAHDKYVEDLADFKAKGAVEAYRIQAAREAQQARWRQKLAEAKTRYGAEADSAILQTAQRISKDEKVHPVVKAVLDESPVLADLLYVMGSEADSADFDAFMTEARERPGLAIRRAVLLEKLVQDELAKTPPAAATERARDENGQFVAAAAAQEKPPAKKVTAAPAPPAEVSGQGSPPGDESLRASQANDFRSFRAIENRKTIARLKGS